MSALDFQPGQQNERAFSAFLEWVKLPPRLREPVTMRDFSELHDVPYDTLAKWKYNDKVRSYIRKQRAAFADGHMPEIMRIALASAKIMGKDGSADRRLIFEWLGYTGKDTSITINNNDNRSVVIQANTANDEELVRMYIEDLVKGEDIPENIQRRLEQKILGTLEQDRESGLTSLGLVEDTQFEYVGSSNGISPEGEVPEESIPLRDREDGDSSGDDPVEPAT